jgi:hypothetical protein
VLPVRWLELPGLPAAGSIGLVIHRAHQGLSAAREQVERLRVSVKRSALYGYTDGLQRCTSVPYLSMY